MGINRNCQNKSESRICQGVASPFLVRWAVYRQLALRGHVQRSLHDPKVFINSHHPSIRVWVLLRLIWQEQFRRSLVCEIPTS